MGYLAESVGFLVSGFIGKPTIFLYFVGWLAVALAAAIFARQATMRFAISIIILSWFLSRFWYMAFPAAGLGYLAIDVFLVGAFMLRWRNQHDVFAKHLLIIHLGFIVLHFLSEIIDLSTDAFFGAPRTHDWMYGMWRNRLFETSLAYIIFMSSIRIAIRRSPWAASVAEKIARRFFRDLPAFVVHTINTFITSVRKRIAQIDRARR